MIWQIFKWRWWDQRWKWLTDQIVGRWKDVLRRKSTIQSLLLEIVIGWKYVDSREKRKDVCHVTSRLNEWERNDYLIQNSSNTKVIFLNITLRTGLKLNWKKKFIAFQMKNEKKTPILNEMQLSINGKYGLLFHS